MTKKTGLTDKNNKEICESDILKAGKAKNGYMPLKGIFPVVFQNNHFTWSDIKLEVCLEYCEMEIVEP